MEPISLHRVRGYVKLYTKELIELEHTILEAASCDHTSSTERKSHHSEKTKRGLMHRLNRIEGQVRGVKGLIERDTYCDDVLIQIASIQSALNGLGKQLLEHHLKSCVVGRIEEGDHEVLDELLITVNKLLK
ncbi:CsoR family transcriptional regulator [Paenibacillus sp. MY03]|nr:CsoR family transcriptional regulator [Paenibacillus sp. MY03]